MTVPIDAEQVARAFDEWHEKVKHNHGSFDAFKAGAEYANLTLIERDRELSAKAQGVVDTFNFYDKDPADRS